MSRATMTWHVGTHMDAPGHFVPGAARVDTFPLDAGIGPARGDAAGALFVPINRGGTIYFAERLSTQAIYNALVKRGADSMKSAAFHPGFNYNYGFGKTRN